MFRKLQKRIQLKNMIILKFRNKYACTTPDWEDQLNQFIQERMDWLFAQEHFDERDLVRVDKEVMQKFIELNDPKRTNNTELID